MAEDKTVTMPRGIFITGTDTGVGKTFVAATLLCGLRASGIDAVPMKPVQTGCRVLRGRYHAPDLRLCLKTSGLTVSAGELADMAPYCFKPACSPHLAAQQAGVTIRTSAIERAFRNLVKRHDYTIVEGAGGVMVPLNERETMLTLMVRLKLPVVLVARAGLGTINHTLLSLEALRHANVQVAGIIINQSVPDRWGDIERDNLRAIEKMGQVRILASIRYGQQIDPIRLAKSLMA